MHELLYILTTQVQKIAVTCLQRNIRKYMAVQNWSWWKLYTKVLPLLDVHRTEEELKSKTVGFTFCFHAAIFVMIVSIQLFSSLGPIECALSALINRYKIPDQLKKVFPFPGRLWTKMCMVDIQNEMSIYE